MCVLRHHVHKRLTHISRYSSRAGKTCGAELSLRGFGRTGACEVFAIYGISPAWVAPLAAKTSASIVRPTHQRNSATLVGHLQFSPLARKTHFVDMGSEVPAHVRRCSIHLPRLYSLHGISLLQIMRGQAITQDVMLGVPPRHAMEGHRNSLISTELVAFCYEASGGHVLL